jgi:UDP-3-O-[3-hydroxymyristoyl] glucosamine N-acyltransferase
MPDSRFYDALGPASLAELAELTGASLATPGDGAREVVGVAPLVRAGAGDIAFVGGRRYLKDLEASGAGACFARPDYAARAPKGCAVLVTRQPQAAYVKAALRLHRPRPSLALEAIHPEAELEADVRLAHGVVIGPGARIGAGTVIGPNP